MDSITVRNLILYHLFFNVIDSIFFCNFFDVSGDTQYDAYVLAFQECGNKNNRDAWIKTIGNELDLGYTILGRVDMWEMVLVIFIHSEHVRFISVVETCSEATGISIAKKLTGKQLGNKGAVAIGFRWHDTPLCFIGSHLAARPERVLKRNSNYQQIIEKLSLKMGQDLCVGGKSGKRAPQLTHVFEHVFWLGDLNYRLDHMFSHAVNLVANGDWSKLVLADQLKREMKSGRAFAEFHEGSLNTCPSYRWNRTEHQFSDKRGKSPSYTDRILWRSMPGVQHDIKTIVDFQTHVDIFGSDHRPVSSGFQLLLRLPYVPLPGPVSNHRYLLQYFSLPLFSTLFFVTLFVLLFLIRYLIYFLYQVVGQDHVS
jgi:phosphatidylinositol-3,4,5-trisphosphate 5-phosphatase 1